MSQPYIVKLDLERVASNLAVERGAPFTVEEAIQWLQEAGFEREGDAWVAEAAVIAEMREDEILDAHPFFGDPVDPGIFTPEVYRRGEPYYTLPAHRRKQLSLLPDYDRLLIPQFLCGTSREVRQECRKLVRKAIKAKSWAPALIGEAMIHIDDAPGLVLMVQKSAFTDQDNILVYILTQELNDIALSTLERLDAYSILRDLRIEGTADFWFSLCMTAGSQRWLPVMPPAYRDDKGRAARSCFPNIMGWWAHFAARDDRYQGFGRSGWPYWGFPQDFYSLFGWPITWEYLKSVDALTAAKRFWELWDEDKKQISK